MKRLYEVEVVTRAMRWRAIRSVLRFYALLALVLLATWVGLTTIGPYWFLVVLGVAFLSSFIVLAWTNPRMFL